MILEVLKYVLLVVGIIAVGALIVFGLGNLMLSIIDPHGRQAKKESKEKQEQIVYEQTLAIEQAHVEDRVEQKDVQDVDMQKAREEELALSQNNSFATLSEEEDEFIREKQRHIEERMAAKNAQEEPAEEINLDDIFVDSDKEEKPEPAIEEIAEDDDDEDIDALINRILAESDDEDETTDEVEEEPVVAPSEEPTEEVATMDDVVEEDNIETEQHVEEEPAIQEQVVTEEAVIEETEVEEPALAEEQEETVEEVVEEQPVEEVAEANEADERVKALEEELARQKEEYEARLQEAAKNAKDEEAEALKNARIEELEKALAEKDAALIEAQNKPTAAMLTLEEYETRLETLKERLKANDKELRAVKKEYLPLAKIKKSWEKDKVKLRRKEALVAKQKVVLYGVNNYVDIDEEKAKKLTEDLDLLDGLRLSVQHCEEVMKANEERFPILENSYNILLATNENIKADIEECNARIEELKANQETEE